MNPPCLINVDIILRSEKLAAKCPVLELADRHHVRISCIRGVELINFSSLYFLPLLESSVSTCCDYLIIPFFDFHAFICRCAKFAIVVL